MVTRLHKVPGPFKSHQPTGLEKGDDLIKYPPVKHDTSTKKSDKLQTPFEVDLRARSNFVFAASQKFFDPEVMEAIRKSSQRHPIPDFSSNLCSCAVAITAEVKATSSLASLTAAWNQLSSLAYTQMMERISISREATYVGDENICQYGYCICSLEIWVWKMSLKWNKGASQRSEALNHYFSFPIQLVINFNLAI